MKLVLYASEAGHYNNILDRSLSQLAKKDPVITFIPASSYQGEFDFRDFVKQKKKGSMQKFIYSPIDVPMDEVLKKRILKSDIIHLGGGNTFQFLHALRKAKFLPDLKAFVQRGGVLSGTSAGAILMTPSVSTADFPSFDKDDNDEGIKNFRAMGLVPFEFFPHYKNSKRYEQAMLARSQKTKIPLYACPDGSGVVIEDSSIKFVGLFYCFYRGTKQVLPRIL